MFMHKFPLVIAFMVLVTTAVFSQEPRYNVVPVVPDAVMRHVVGNILQDRFKPAPTERTIPLYHKNIKREWLPSIANITFQMVSDRELDRHPDGVYFFGEVMATGDTFNVYFGFGDPHCDSEGHNWKFTVPASQSSKTDKPRPEINIWLSSISGTGCGGRTKRIINDLEIGELSPNELPGYKFFAEGKLKDLRLGISNRKDVEAVFGDDCDGVCDYDQNWKIFLNYFGDSKLSRREIMSDGTEYEIELNPKKEYIDRIESMRLIPKNRVSFSDVKFAPTFSRGGRFSIGDAWGKDGFEGAVHSSQNVLSDSWGLSYVIYNEETFNNLKEKTGPNEKPVNGDLLSIEYEIPKNVKDKMYEIGPRRQIVKK